jgi:hypothetical protein
MPRKRWFIASLDQVRITRRNDTAIIEYADPDIGDTHYKLGPVIDKMTDQQILDHFNEHLAATERMRQEHEHIAVEIPIGKPQIEYYERGDQWVPRGEVLRCQIHDADGEPVIEIDDRELSWDAFGRLLTTFSGWGARILFVPGDEIHLDPKIEVREPDPPRG